MEHSHIEPVPLCLKIMHWVPRTKTLNLNDFETNIRICMGLYPRSTHNVAKMPVFRAHEQNLLMWATGPSACVQDITS